MSNLENGPGISNNNQGNEPNEKKPKTSAEVLLGILISAFFYIVTVGIFNMNSITPAIREIVLFIILGLFVFVCVKLFRTKHRLAGTLVIVLTSPLILFMLLAGACVLMLGGL